MSNTGPADSAKGTAFIVMRRGLSLMIASYIIIAVALFLLLTYVAYAVMGAGLSSYGEVLSTMSWDAILVAGLIMLLFTGALYLYGALGKFIPGVSRLVRVDSSYSASSMLIKLGFLGGLISLILGVILMVAGIFSTPLEALREMYTSPPTSEEAAMRFLQSLHPFFLAGAVFVTFGLIFILLYQLGLVILLMKLKEKEKISTYGIAGYLLLARIVMYFIPAYWGVGLGGVIELIALLLFRSALGDSLRKTSIEPLVESPQVQLPRYPEDTSISL